MVCKLAGVEMLFVSAALPFASPCLPSSFALALADLCLLGSKGVSIVFVV